MPTKPENRVYKAEAARESEKRKQDDRIMEIHQAGGAVLVVDDVAQLDELEKRYGRTA